MSSDLKILERLYDRFNARDMEAVLAMMHRNVLWAKVWKAGTSTDTTRSAAIGRDSGR
jgi:hypothetical protein